MLEKHGAAENQTCPLGAETLGFKALGVVAGVCFWAWSFRDPLEARTGDCPNSGLHWRIKYFVDFPKSAATKNISGNIV